MRGLRSTIVLLVVLAGFGAYIYFVTWKQPATTASNQEKVFAGLDADHITGLTVTAEGGDVTKLAKVDGKWTMTSPIQTGVDDATVSGITSALSSIDVTRVIDDKGTDPAQYGLATPPLQVEFTVEGDKTPHKLLIGSKSPTGASLYARRNDEPQIFLIPQFQEATFNKGTFDLRAKSVLASFDRTKLNSFDIKDGKQNIELTKKGEAWTLTAPVHARADFGTVESTIGQIESLQMKAVAAENATDADLKKFGLVDPAVTATLHTADKTISLEIGGAAADDTVYARDGSSKTVVTIDKSLDTDLTRAADEYRRHDVFDFRSYNATKAELTRKGQTIAFERVKGKGDNAVDTWKRTSPTTGDADKDKVEAFLSKLADLHADSFVSSTKDTGLDHPVLSVHMTFNDGANQESATFGQSGDNSYAEIPGDDGADKISTSALNEVLTSLDALAK
jgi:Domain of unknown function (DUF4340)